ncbi:MAG: hypothetical protein PHT12_00530 [Patescibacteria group bacterium]|nr:hypothetical protein [Patescibacteria group bacterium]
MDETTDAVRTALVTLVGCRDEEAMLLGQRLFSAAQPRASKTIPGQECLLELRGHDHVFRGQIGQTDVWVAYAMTHGTIAITKIVMYEGQIVFQATRPSGVNTTPDIVVYVPGADTWEKDLLSQMVTVQHYEV